MRAVVIGDVGDASGLRVVEREIPSPGPGQVLVRTEAIGVGGVDVMIRRGGLGSSAVGTVAGGEVAGAVSAVGDRVDGSWVGRRVWAATGTSGAYAEQAVAHVDDVTAIPSALSSVAAVTLGSAATVAHFALAHARVSPGESVLVRGAAGSIGIAAVQLAARAGAGAVAVTTSSADRGRRLRDLGATHVLDRSGAGDAGSVDVVLDVVGGADVPAFLDRLSPNGRYVLVGAVAGFPPADLAAPLLRTFQLSRSFATFSLASVGAAERNRAREQLFLAAVRGQLAPVVDAVLPLDQAAEAHRQMDRGTVFGRIVLVPDQP
ncbi:zinc-binding dehydrogenase [Cellulomonas sp. NTE-D12]|uniref:zinc-binding dehydrogenase n=1 Tax=Cellulomonas sp. NTE-D12 TaxID=2962632 RepID=UPI00308158DE|nr:oxidoreductase [Cellulomonas sp. NTE-D12]